MRAIVLLLVIAATGCSGARQAESDGSASPWAKDGGGDGGSGEMDSTARLQDDASPPSEAAPDAPDDASAASEVAGPDAGGPTQDGGTIATSPNSPYVPAGYRLVFSDEFDESRLDTSKWWTRFVYSNGTLDYLNDEKQRYRETNNHVMTGSSIKLMAYKVRSNGPNGVDYESGMLRSKIILKYGYLEARVRMPGGLGVWPAFWLNAEAPPWPPEIDIFEFVNNGVEDKVNMLHTGVIDHGAQGSAFLSSDPSFNAMWTYWTAPFNFPDAFHVVALLWDATTAATYVDGTMIVKRGYKWVHDDGSDAGYAHVLLNLAIGGQWAGRHGIDDTAFPQGLEIDYVRVYQNQMNVSQSGTGQDLCPDSGGC